MRVSQYLLHTQREAPAEAEIISHQLMLRTGMVRQLASGLYSWLPLGLRVFRKVESIVREEMNAAGGIELSLPVVQPAELWQESQRWSQFGPELLRIRDRHDREFCLGPTHEEVITDIVRNDIRSYRQLPVNLYQIQTKFRDERRPRFGVMRTREFCMKDAYSFHINEESLQTTYETMYKTYGNIFTRAGLNFRAVIADTGSIGGSHSHEFHVLADSGEDAIVFSDGSDFAANIEKAAALAPPITDRPAESPLSKIATPNTKSIEQVCLALDIRPRQIVKTLIVKGSSEDGEPALAALVLRGDHQLNEIKAQRALKFQGDFSLASEEDILNATQCCPGSLGPVGLDLRIIVDHSAASLSNFVCGANLDGYHWVGVNWARDCAALHCADLRNVVDGDPSPDGKGTLMIARGIEVGHIFQLGTKYSKTMKASVLDENGEEQLMHMGCYGIGVGRIVAAAIEQNHDAQGISWPDAIAPFQIALIPINYHKSDSVKQTSDSLYQQLCSAGYEVLFFDEKKARLGGMLADVELIGIPHRIVIGERNLNAGTVEYRNRKQPDNLPISLQSIMDFLLQNTVAGQTLAAQKV